MTIPGSLYTPTIRKTRTSVFPVDNSAMFNDDDSEYLTITPSGAGTSNKIGTISLWAKRGNLGEGNLVTAGASASNYNALTFKTDDKIQFAEDSNNFTFTTTAVFRDPHAWYHIVVAFDTTQGSSSNRVKFYVNGSQITAFDTETYPAQDFVMNYGTAIEHNIGRLAGVGGTLLDGYLAEVVYIDGSQLTPTSFGEFDSNSVWRPIDVLAQSLTFGTNGFYLPFTTAAGLGQDYSGSTTETKVQENTYAAGSEVNKGDMDSAGFTAGAKFTAVASAALPTVKIRASSTGFSGVTVRIETGSSTAPSGTLVDSNAEVTGITSAGAGLKTADFPNGGPVLVAGTTYWIVLAQTGNWGWQHDVSGSGGALGIRDGSGYQAGRGLGHEAYQLGNIFTPVNSPTQTTDSPTTNAATLSPLYTDSTLSTGNLKAVATGNAYQWAISSIAIPDSGKWTCEFQSSNINGSSLYGYIGIAQMGNHNVKTGTSYRWGMNLGNGEVFNGSGSSVHNFSTSAYATTLMRLEYDADADTIKIFSAGSEIFPASTGASATVGLTGQNSLHFFCAPYGSGADFTATFKDLSGTPTANYKELTAVNLYENSAPAIADGSAFFQPTTYSGVAGANEVNQTGNSTFQPDLVWIRRRDGAGDGVLFDSTRTTSSGEYIRSSNSGATGNESAWASFDDNGFSFDGADTNVETNTGSRTYVAWQWLAGGTAPTKTYTVKVVDDSGNKYRFDDFGTSAVTLDLQEGGTYTFDASDSSVNTHPFVIGTSADGSEYSTGVTYQLDGVSKTYSQYTSGFAAASSRKLIITVAASAPALYYWCSNHSGMGGSINTNSTFGSSYFDGTIQSQVSVNQTAGFSIVRYTGTGSAGTVGHGLSVAPDMIHNKRLTQNESWISYLSTLGGTKHVYLNLNFAEATASNVFNNTAATTSLFSLGDAGSTNTNTETYIAYCFASIPGYSAAGSFTGNDNTDGPLIETGFSPALVVTKKTSSATGG